MQAMPGQSLQSKELAATPRLGSNPVGTSEIGDDKSIDIVVLVEVNIVYEETNYEKSSTF